MVTPVNLSNEKVSPEILTELKKHMDNVITALEKNSSPIILNACINLGLFFQENFRTTGTNVSAQDTLPAEVEDISKSLKEFKNEFDGYTNQQLSLDKLYGLLEVQPGVQMAINELGEKNQNVLQPLKAMKLGMNMFFLLGAPAEYKPPESTEKEKYIATIEIYDIIPPSDTVQTAKTKTIKNEEQRASNDINKEERNARAAILLKTMEKDCIETIKHLGETLSKEASKLPGGGSQYYKINENKNIIVGVFDIDRLTNDITKKEGAFAKGGLYDKKDKASMKAITKLTTTIENYQDAYRLATPLTYQGKQAPIVKLGNFRHAYERLIAAKQGNNTLADSKMSRFLKKIGHLLEMNRKSKEQKLVQRIGEKLDSAITGKNPILTSRKTN